MNKSRLLLASLIVFSLVFGVGHNAYSWPWSKKGSDITEKKQNKQKKKKQSKKKKSNKKSRKNTR